MTETPDIARVLAHEKRYRLFADLDAKLVQAELGKVGVSGALSGQVIGLKANIASAGAKWSAGLRHRAEIRAETDANVTKRLRDAGALILPGFNMDAAALGGTTENPDFGRTANPRAQDYCAGGSSGGSAAAVAAGLVDVAIGTDTLGSIRIPASYCGIFGIKPTFGLVGRSGILPLAPSLDTAGLLAAHAADLWPVLKSIAGADAEDPDSRLAPPLWGQDGPMQSAQGLRIGIPEQIANVSCASECLDALNRTAAALGACGAEICQVSMPGWQPARLRQKAFLLTECEGAAVFSDELMQGGVLPRDVEALLGFGRDLPSAKLIAALGEIRAAKAQLDRTFREVDVLLMPTTPQRAFPKGTAAPANQADFTTLANAGGVPALAVPVAIDGEALHASVQLVGPGWSEPRLIGLASELEHHLFG